MTSLYSQGAIIRITSELSIREPWGTSTRKASSREVFIPQVLESITGKCMHLLHYISMIQKASWEICDEASLEEAWNASSLLHDGSWKKVQHVFRGNTSWGLFLRTQPSTQWSTPCDWLSGLWFLRTSSPIILYTWSHKVWLSEDLTNWSLNGMFSLKDIHRF